MHLDALIPGGYSFSLFFPVKKTSQCFNDLAKISQENKSLSVWNSGNFG